MESLPPDDAAPTPPLRDEPAKLRLPELFAGFRHRRIYQVVLGYAVVAWLVLQVSAVVLPGLDAPKWLLRVVIVVALAGLGGALLAGWMLDRRTMGKTLLPRGARAVGYVLLSTLPAAAMAAWFLSPPAWKRPTRSIGAPAIKLDLPEKSIAVLPFDSLSADQDNAFFTDGVQDEILTDLARVADLKVISRTSVMQYRGNSARNLRDIAAQLGVAHVVEGSVQRAGHTVRVNAQLIDARTDAHEWAMNYDRPLNDVFAIQSEIAQAIADQLRAKISPEEHVAMTHLPTTDVLALQLYQQAQELESRQADSDARDGLLQAVDLLEQATKRDPGFLPAYCLLCQVHLDLYWEDFDHTDARREAGHVALTQAVRVGPDAGETHLAQALYAYHGFRDYDRALAELSLARRSLPNSAEVTSTLAVIYRRQGRWDECTREFERAAEQDPRNFETLQETAFTYGGLRCYGEAARFYERALAVVPGDTFTREMYATLSSGARADFGPLRALNAAIVRGAKPAELEVSAFFRLTVALDDRDAEGARAALTTLPAAGDPDNTNVLLPKEWFAGVCADVFGDAASAQANFAAAREKMAAQVRTQPDYAEAWSALGRIDAMLDRKDDALREGRRAADLLPVSKDAWDGPAIASNLAAIYARTGNKDLALQVLENLIQQKLGNAVQEISYGALKLDPRWEPLRGDPRFDALVAALAPSRS